MKVSAAPNPVKPRTNAATNAAMTVSTNAGVAKKAGSKVMRAAKGSSGGNRVGGGPFIGVSGVRRYLGAAPACTAHRLQRR